LLVEAPALVGSASNDYSPAVGHMPTPESMQVNKGNYWN